MSLDACAAASRSAGGAHLLDAGAAPRGAQRFLRGARVRLGALELRLRLVQRGLRSPPAPRPACASARRWRAASASPARAASTRAASTRTSSGRDPARSKPSCSGRRLRLALAHRRARCAPARARGARSAPCGASWSPSCTASSVIRPVTSNARSRSSYSTTPWNVSASRRRSAHPTSTSQAGTSQPPPPVIYHTTENTTADGSRNRRPPGG